MGMKMPGWYDIYSFEGLNSKEDDAGVNESARYIKQLVDQEIAAGTPVQRIVVAGFSQGGAIALMSLRQIEGLAGVVGMKDLFSALCLCGNLLSAHLVHGMLDHF